MPYTPLNFFDWELTPEQITTRDTIGRWVDETVVPVIGDAFEQGRFPVELVPELARLGVLGARLPGYGAGLDPTSWGLICQELERGDSGLRSFVSVQSSLCMFPIFQFGSQEQKDRYLPPMARGELIACFGLTESEHGSDPAGMTTRAVRNPDGSWTLNGAKQWITNGRLAGLAIVWARVAEDGRDTVRGFLVETGRPGFRVNDIPGKLSLRASETSELVLEDCHLPADAVLPGVQTMRGPLSCLTEARFGIAFGAVGAATACYQAALDYAGRRVQWGRPIAGFQLTQDKLVNALQAITQGQLLAYQLGRLKESGTLRPAQISLAKRANCQMALDVARSMRSILGANGVTLDYPVFRHMANMESVYTYEGTHEIHTLVVGAEITGHDALRG